jgi:hypothetical protein
MAARRLIIVMLVLLGISTAIAIVAPNPTEQTTESGSSDTTTGSTGQAGNTGPTGDTGSRDGGPGAGAVAGGKGATGERDSGAETPGGSTPGTVEAEVAVSRAEKPASVCALPGSRLVLTVTTGGVIDLSVPDFGRTASATSYAPAVFDLLMPADPGRYPVEALETGRTLARIVSNQDCRQGGRNPAPKPVQPRG